MFEKEGLYWFIRMYKMLKEIMKMRMKEEKKNIKIMKVKIRVRIRKEMKINWKEW